MREAGSLVDVDVLNLYVGFMVWKVPKFSCISVYITHTGVHHLYKSSPHPTLLFCMFYHMMVYRQLHALEFLSFFSISFFLFLSIFLIVQLYRIALFFH